MREYEKEAIDLESLLRNKGILNADTEKFALADLVNFYGLTYLQHGPLCTLASSFPDYGLHIAKTKEPLPWEVAEEVVLKEDLSKRKLSDDQTAAWTKLRKWAVNGESYFVLRGFAGTGKTFLLQLLNELSISIYYSAPTNKAAKVLGKAVSRVAKTTYSILGLKMEQTEDELILTSSSNPPYFPANSILVIDEASMVGRQLFEAVKATCKRCNIKILFVGDPAQLPPVGEISSLSWKATQDPDCNSMLKEVMRYDNQLLVLATALRNCIKTKNWCSPVHSDHTETGIWKWSSSSQFERNLLKRVESGDMIDAKVIAWRNKTVDRYNNIIRQALGYKEVYCVNDLLLLAEPIEENGSLIAHTDDEFKVTSVDQSQIIIEGTAIDVWQLAVTGDQNLILEVARDQSQVDALLSKKAKIARSSSGMSRKTAWQDFWKTKSRFNKVRYGNALTAHRAQGSTYTNVWLDQMDILANSNKREAFRCLYVAATRPTKNLYSF